MIPVDNNLDPFGLRRTAEAARRGPSHIKFLFVFIGTGIVMSFLTLVSLAPQVGEKLGNLAVRKQTQESRAAFINPQGPCAPIGDVDINAKVNSVDALKIQRYVAGYSISGQFNTFYADVNRDRIVTSADSQKILRYISGLETTWDACKSIAPWP